MSRRARPAPVPAPGASPAGAAAPGPPALLRRFVEDLPAAVAMFDLDMRCLAASRRWVQALGLDAQAAPAAAGLHLAPCPALPPRWRERHARVLRGEPLEGEAEPFEHGGGRVDWLRWRMAPWHDEGGRIGGALLFFETVTARVEAERAHEEALQRLREGDRRFRTLVDSVPTIVWVCDAQYAVTYLNRRWYALTGQDPAKALGQGWLAAVHPDDLAPSRAVLSAALARGEGLEFQLRYRRHDGQWRWHLARSEPLRDDAGAIQAWFGNAFDVHEQRLASQRAAHLLALEERLRDAATAREAVQAACETLGRALQAAFVGMGELQEGDGSAPTLLVESGWRADAAPFPPGPHRLPPDVARRLDLLQSGAVLVASGPEPAAAPEGGAPVAAMPGLGPGTLVVPLLRQGRLRALLVVDDASPRAWDDIETRLAQETLERAWQAAEQARAEAALRAREAHLAALHAQTSAGLCETDLDGRFLDANPRYCEIVGRPLNELRRLRMQDITHPEDLPANLPLFRRLTAQGTPFSLEKRYLRPDGAVVWIANSVNLVQVPGMPPRVLAVTIDVSARRQVEARLRTAEAGLRERHALLAAVLASTDNAVFAKDREGRYRLINEAGARFMQRRVEDFLGRSDAQVFDPALAAALVRTDRQVLDAGQPLRYEDDTGVGTPPRTFLTTKTPLLDERGLVVGVVGVAVDITEQKAAQARLAEALQAREALLYEVNHRVKNNLQVVSSLLSLQARATPDPDARRAIGQAQARVTVVARLHQQLYESGHHGALDFGRYARRLAQDTLASLGGGRRIALDFTGGAELLLEPDQAVPLALVISELVTNAVKYAFPGERRGTLTLRIGRDGLALALLVADDGVGLPTGFRPEDSPGLGMKIVLALVAQLRGRLELVRREGGAAFRIETPLSQD